MARKSIGDLHSKVTADAQQFINEFKRADNESRRSSAAIDREVGALVKNVKKKFSASDIGKDVLKGLGIGSGFAVAQQAVDLIVQQYQAAAEAAQNVAASTEKQLASVKELIKLRQTEQEQMLTAQREMARLQKDIDERKPDASLIALGILPNTKKLAARYGTPALSNEQIAENAASAAEMQAKALEIERLAKKSAEDAAAAAAKQANAEMTDALAKRKALADQIEHGNKMFLAEEERLKKLGETYALVADPSLRFTQQLAEAEEAMQAGKLSAEQYAAAVREITYAKEKDQASRVDERLKDFFEGIDGDKLKKVEEKMSTFESSMNQMWENVADRAAASFAQMVIDGEASFGDLARLVAQTMIEITARMAIINPLMNGIFNLSGAAAMPAFYGSGTDAARATAMGGAHAVGGAVAAGMLYPVNEQGPEMLSIGNRDYLMTGSQGGMVMPANRTANAMGGTTYHFHYTIPDAITRAELMPMLKATQQSTIATLRDLNRRGKA